jgi:hypothetical protein
MVGIKINFFTLRYESKRKYYYEESKKRYVDLRKKSIKQTK